MAREREGEREPTHLAGCHVSLLFASFVVERSLLGLLQSLVVSCFSNTGLFNIQRVALHKREKERWR